MGNKLHQFKVMAIKSKMTGDSMDKQLAIRFGIDNRVSVANIRKYM